MINIVIPMAGLGSRFSKQGYTKPKPFIDVFGVPMIEAVMNNLLLEDANYILIGQRQHLMAEMETVERLKASYNVVFIPLDELTEGTACTVLTASEHIDSNDPLIIANCDQLLDFDFGKFVFDCTRRDLDGSIVVFQDIQLDKKWSFARLGSDGLVDLVKEKQVISNLATVGVYMFRRGADFIKYSLEMIDRNDRVNGEFYTCPVYNYAIADNRRIGIYEISGSAMHGLGTPEDLELYIKSVKIDLLKDE